MNKKTTVTVCLFQQLQENDMSYDDDANDKRNIYIYIDTRIISFFFKIVNNREREKESYIEC